MSRHWIVLAALSALAAMTGPAGAADGSITLRVSDRLGHAEAAVFSVTDAKGAAIADAADPGQPVVVPPGSWIVVPRADPKLAQSVTVADGQALSLEIKKPDGLWLSFRGEAGRPARWALIEPKPPDAMAAALARFDLSRFENGLYLAARRPEVAPATASAALALARAEYGKQSTDTSDSGQAAWDSAQIFAGRILAALGDAGDADRLSQDQYLYNVYVDLLIAARIEKRLGTIERGRLMKLAEGGESIRTAAAAILLQQAGVDRGSARLLQLLHGSADAPYLQWRETWAAALELPAPSVEDAFALQVQRLEARAAAIAALPQDQRASASNEYEPTRVPVLIHALMTRRDDQLRALVGEPLDPYDALALAPFVANPGEIAGLLMGMTTGNADRIEAVANLCALADRPDAAVFKDLTDAAFAAGRGDAKRRTDLAPAAAGSIPYDYVNFLSTVSAPCRPSRATGEYFLTHNDDMLPFATWIPVDSREEPAVNYLLDGKGGYRIPNVAATLEDIAPDRLEQLLGARGDAAKAYPINLYRAYHQAATRANFLFPIYSEGGFLLALRRDTTAGRPYVFGRLEPADNSYGGALDGILSLRIEPLDKLTRLHVRLDQSVYYHFDGGLIDFREGDLKKWEVYPYTLDRGRKLIAGVRLSLNGNAIAVKDTGVDQEGALLFDVEQRLDDMAGVVAEIDLAYFDQTRQLLFELYDSDAGRAVRRAARMAQDAAAQKPGDLQGLLSLARAQASAGLLEQAEQSYRRTTALASGDSALWLEAGRAFLGHEDLRRSISFFADGWKAFPDDASLVTALAGAQFRAAAYADAAKSYASLARNSQQAPQWRYWQGVSALLGGDFAQAQASLAQASAGYEPAQTRMFQRLAAELAAGKKPEPFPDYDQFSATLPEGYARAAMRVFAGADSFDVAVKAARTADELCGAWFWAGERKALAGDAVNARDLLHGAASRCAPTSPQYRLAQQMLTQLPAP